MFKQKPGFSLPRRKEGWLQDERGESTLSAWFYTEALAVIEETGMRPFVGHVHQFQGLLPHGTGDLVAAAGHYDRALFIYSRSRTGRQAMFPPEMGSWSRV